MNSNFNKTNKMKKTNIVVIIIGICVIVGLAIFIILRGTKSQISSIDINENNAIDITASGSLLEDENIKNAKDFNHKLEEQNEGSYDYLDFEDSAPVFGSDKVGSDNIDMMKQNAYSIDINSKTISITASGTLLEVEKIQNIDALNQQLEKTNEDYYDFLDFEDSDPVFTEEKVGDDIYRKMYSKNYKFDLRSPIINGYNLNNLEQQEILDVGKTNKVVLGTVYFDYGYANWPKSAVVQVQKTTLGKIEFNKTRYTETVTGLKYLLSEIPQSALPTTVFYLDGHTDGTSSHDFNQTLSEARAESIKEILINNFGISEKNIVTKGNSWDCLAVNTMEECAENRRVEISIVFFN